MSVNSGLHFGEIDCLVLRLVDDVFMLGVFARDELFDFICEIRISCIILNTDSKAYARTYWLALYAYYASIIELFD